MEGNILNSNNETFLYEYIKTFFEKRTAFEVHPAISLIELVDSKNNAFSKEERDFIKRTSRVDVVVTKGYGRRKAIYVFESNSNLHNVAKQKKRDELKDKILRRSGINIFRFRDHHYQLNKSGERFIDAVLSSLSNEAFVEALTTITAWEDEPLKHHNHPVFWFCPIKKNLKHLFHWSKTYSVTKSNFVKNGVKKLAQKLTPQYGTNKSYLMEKVNNLYLQ